MKYKTIPTGWRNIKIQNIADVSAGGTPSTKHPEYWGGEILWMNSGDLNKRTIFDVEGRITQQGLASSSAKIVPKNSVLIGLAGQGKTRGTVAINKVELTTNQSVAFFMPHNIDYKFLYYDLFRRYLELRSISAGDGGRGGLNLQILKNLTLLLPPLPEQEKIVEVLETWDEYLGKIARKIKVKKIIKRGLLQKLLTEKIRLKGFNKEWKTVKLKNIFIITAGRDLIKNKYSFKRDKTHPYPVYSNALSNKGVYGYSEEYQYEGDYITVTARGSIGTANFREGRFNAIGRLLVLKPYIKCNCFFISELINHKIIFAIESTGVPQLTAPQISNYKIPFPTIEEQTAIAQILTTADQEIEALEKKHELIKAQKKFLLNNLVAGKIRLPEFNQ